MEQVRSPHLHLAKRYWQELLQPNHLAIDATCGNGHDTLFLAGLCHVIGLDIQPAAIHNTEKLLAQSGKKAVLHRLSHAKIDDLPLPEAPHLIIYNLGYLPAGDKSVTTRTETTLESLQKSLHLIARGGAICITCYPGHDEGAKEEEALLELVSNLPFPEWHICHHRWLNRPRSPSLLWIQRST